MPRRCKKEKHKGQKKKFDVHSRPTAADADLLRRQRPPDANLNTRRTRAHTSLAVLSEKRGGESTVWVLEHRPGQGYSATSDAHASCSITKSVAGPRSGGSGSSASDTSDETKASGTCGGCTIVRSEGGCCGLLLDAASEQYSSRERTREGAVNGRLGNRGGECGASSRRTPVTCGTMQAMSCRARRQRMRFTSVSVSMRSHVTCHLWHVSCSSGGDNGVPAPAPPPPPV